VVGVFSQCKNNYFTEMCSGSEAGSYLRLIDFVYHSTLGSRAIKKKKRRPWFDRLGVVWEGYHESRRCSRDTYPESYTTKYTSIRIFLRRLGPGNLTTAPLRNLLLAGRQEPSTLHPEL